MMQDFIQWEMGVRPEVEHVLSILKGELSDEPEKLIADLQEIEAWNARIGTLLADANSWLDKLSMAAFPSRENGKTETDRKLILDHKMSPVRQVRDTLDSICDSIRQRLILGESILSYHKQRYAERKSNLDNIF